MLLTTVIIGLLALAVPAFAAKVPELPAPPEEEQPGPGVDNPIRKVSDMMKKAGDMLRRLDTGAPTQDQQKKILAELDVLIEMAMKQSSQSSGGQQQQQGDPQDQQPGGQKPTPGASPMPSERDILRAVQSHPGKDAPDLKNLWGKLPDAPRGEIMQLLSEKLPMKYKQLLILYLKALSEKK